MTGPIITLCAISELKSNPLNPNKHESDQIERLAALIKYQGFRNPIVVSSRSGFIVAGHGRLEAAKKLGMESVPVMVQAFESEAQEYAYLVSDNAIAEWADLDFSAINDTVIDLGPDFELDLLGIKDFTVDVAEKDTPEKKPKVCPSCGHEF